MTHFKRPLALTLLAASLAIPATFAAVKTPATPALPPVVPTPVTTPTAQTPPVADPMAQAPVANTSAMPAADTSTGAMAKTDASSTWASLDVNGDGSISKDEAAADANLSAQFAKYDKDKNGLLSPEEYGKYIAKMGKKSNKSQSKI